MALTNPLTSQPFPASRRQRLIDLAVLNADWLQYHLDNALEAVPRLVRMPMLHALKGMTHGEIDGSCLWKMVPFALHQMTDEQCDSMLDTLHQFLGEL